MKNSPWPAPPSDAPLPRPAEPPGRRKPSLRRYTWSRLHADLPTMDLWGLVAEMASSDRAKVEALVWRLETYASTNRPRGSLEGFPLRALAVTWRCAADELVRIYAALEHPDVGWIEDEVIVTFWERNPDEEDPTGALRAQRSRRRRKIIKAMRAKRANDTEILAELECQGLGYPPSRIVTRDAVTVTARTDQTKQQDQGAAKTFGAVPAAAPQAIQEENGTSGENPAMDPELWLATQGRRIVLQRLNEPGPKAELRIKRWLEKLGGDLAALKDILDRVDATDLVVSQFMAEVSNAIDRHRHQQNGPQLPLRPVMVTNRRASGE